MNRFHYGSVRALAETFALPEPILEIGSFQVAGQEGYANLRSLFPGRDYLGIDMREGPGVDRVANVESLPFADGSFGTVLAMNVFEHVRCFWRGLDEVHRVLRPDGALVIEVPFHFHIHGYPSDYWRFTPQALEVLLERYPHKLIGWNGPKRRPWMTWALAFREQGPAILESDLARYRTLMKQYAREPLPWLRRWRYRLGSWLCGRRPFAPWLERERWEVECPRSQPSRSSQSSYSEAS